METIDEEIRKTVDNFLKVIGSFLKDNKKEVIKTLENSDDPNHFFSVFPDSVGELIFKGLSNVLTQQCDNFITYIKDICSKIINNYINNEKEKILRSKQSENLKQINLIDQDINALKPFYNPLQEKKEDDKYNKLYKLATSFLNKKRKNLLQQINDDERAKENLYKKNTFKINDKITDKFLEIKEKVEKDENKIKSKKSTKKKTILEKEEICKDDKKDGSENNKQYGKTKKKSENEENN